MLSPIFCRKPVISPRPAVSTISSSVSMRAIRFFRLRARIVTTHIPAGCISLRGLTEVSMSSSINVPLTSTSPRFESVERRLTGSVVSRTTDEERDAMYALFESYFAGTDRERFESDLAEKDGVILLRDRDRICGFSTFKWMRGEDCIAFFSGDTII